jgi:hypothetical protein
MTRFLCLLIAAYNFKVVLYTWLLSSHYIFKIAGIPIGPIGLILTLVLVAAIAIHSIRLIMLNGTAIKPQIIISAIDPIFHIFLISIVLLNIVPPEKMPSTKVIAISRSIYTFLDILVIFYLTRAATKESFKLAEETREHKKIMKQGMKI